MEGLSLHDLLCDKEKGSNDDQIHMIGNYFILKLPYNTHLHQLICRYSYLCSTELETE